MKLTTSPTLNGSPGSSLIIVLTLMAILSVLIITAILTVTSEVKQASSSLEQQRSESIAKVALDEVAEKISSIPLDRHWAAAPGRIRYWDGSTWNNTIELHSGNTTSDQTNLNARLPDGSYSILPANDEFPSAPEMKLDWRYVLSDGSVIPGPVPANKTPVGRFAYWTDLENSRVNINTAGLGMTKFDYHLADRDAGTIIAQYPSLVWTSNPWMTDRVTMSDSGPQFATLDRTTAQRTTPQNLVAHPSSIDLSYLEDITEAQSFNTFRYAGSYFLRADARNSYNSPAGIYTPAAPGPDLSVRFFNTPEDWKMIVGLSAYQKNKGYVTTRGRSPEITPWGVTKLLLSQMSKEGVALNDLTETYHRSNGGNYREEYYSQDTRRTQIPAMLPMDSVTLGKRSSFRDITAINSDAASRNPLPSIADFGKDLCNVLSCSFPGYSSNLAAKFNLGSAGETDQVAIELITFVDSCLNGLSAGLAPLTPYKADHDIPSNTNLNYLGLTAPQIAGKTIRRTGSSNPILINELALQAEAVPYSAVTGSDNVIGLTNDLAGGYPAFNPKPIAARSTISNYQNSVYLYLTRNIKPLATNPAASADRFIKVVLRTEFMTSPHNGSFQNAAKMSQIFGQGMEIFVTNNSCTWSSNDPVSGNGSLFYDFVRDTSDSLSWHRRLLFSIFSTGFTYPAQSAAGNTYVQAPASTKGCLLIGPFEPGTIVSSLKFRVRILAHNSLWGGGINFSRYWHMFPGIFNDFTATDTYTNPTSLSDTFLEFEFKDLDVLSPLPHYASCEVNDPRINKRKSDWKVAPAESHSLGAQNTNYSPNGTDGDDSDLSRPSLLLQAIRGQLRYWFVKGNLRNGVERQNASLILGLPGVGYLSSVPTGVDAGIPWKTMNFHKSTDNPPDWLLWNLFYVPFDRSISNQTDGKLNINATLYPFGIQRRKPLEALLGNRVANPGAVAQAIANGPRTSGLPTDMYVYGGEICDVPGIADTGNEFSKEALPRDLADIISTQCSDFRVFIVSQALVKSPNGTITPTATHRAEVTLSREVDSGPQTYSFGESDLGLPSIYLRSSYASQGTDAPRIALNSLKSVDRSPLGVDRIPNTADDWLIPQKLEISSYRTIK